MAGKHDGAVRCVEFDADHGLVISGSWDCSVRCWDPRSNTLVANLRQPHKVYSMTQAGSRLVVATAQRTVNVYEKRMLVSLISFCFPTLGLAALGHSQATSLRVLFERRSTLICATR